MLILNIFQLRNEPEKRFDHSLNGVMEHHDVITLRRRQGCSDISYPEQRESFQTADIRQEKIHTRKLSGDKTYAMKSKKTKQIYYGIIPFEDREIVVH